jgi:hypothetical protein
LLRLFDCEHLGPKAKTFASKNERILILLLCFAAALRVLIFSAAFPFFSNIDEDLHFDLITQYSHADFGECINPSRAHPYFTSGRLLSGVLIPFALFYIYGITYPLRRINSTLPLSVIGLIVIFAASSEISST